jgi:3D (Asp-Asp-Asp) domain-containing protein
MMIKLSVMLFLLSCSTHSRADSNRDPLALDQFNFEQPRDSDLGQKIILWATYYNLPQLEEDSGNYPLRDLKGQELGPRVSHRGWCDAAMEGSVRIHYKNGEAKTFNYANQTPEYAVDCKDFFKIDVSRSKFREAYGPYGDGLKEYILAPYRTIASDNTQIAPGTVLYIPRAKGAIINLDSGRVINHDGYFFVGDRGGAIKDNHIDVFIGTHFKAPFFPWVASNKNKTFEAFVVKDQKIITDLYRLHAK